jgi:hypothetical protein
VEPFIEPPEEVTDRPMATGPGTQKRRDDMREKNLDPETI